jgi:hypothetical protein
MALERVLKSQQAFNKCIFETYGSFVQEFNPIPKDSIISRKNC